MANSEAGWPKQPQGDGIYWWRADANDTDPDIHFVQGEYFYQVGFASSEVVANFGGEFLGPISPSDAEQLIELRKAAQVVRERHQAKAQRCNFDDCGCDDCDVLRAVLNPRHPEKEMQ